jgi:hypothetical protein
MASDQDDVENDPVRDPKTGRFPVGTSGNRKGRPRKNSEASDGPLARALNERVPVTEGGRVKRVRKRDVAFKQLANKSAGGDLRATKLAEDLVAREQAAAAAAKSAAPENLSEIDQQIVARVVARLRLIIKEEDHGADEAR